MEYNSHEARISSSICKHTTKHLPKTKLVYFSNKFVITFDFANKAQNIN